MKKTTPPPSLFPTGNSVASGTSLPLPGWVNILQGQVGRYIEGVTDARYIGLYTDEITTCHIIIVYGVRDGRMRFSLMHDDSSFSLESIRKEQAFIGESNQVIVVKHKENYLPVTSKKLAALNPQERFLSGIEDAVIVSVGNGALNTSFLSTDAEEYTSKPLYNCPQAVRLHVMRKFNLMTDEMDAQLEKRECGYFSEKLLFDGEKFCTYENIGINSMTAFTRETIAHMQKKSYLACTGVYAEMMHYFFTMKSSLSWEKMKSRYGEHLSMLAQMYCYLTDQTGLLENNPHHEYFMKLIHRYSMRQPQSSETKSFSKQPESSSKEGFLTLFRQQQKQKDAKIALSSYEGAVTFYKAGEYTAAIAKVQFSVKYYRRYSKKVALRKAVYLLGRNKFELGNLEEAAGHLHEAKGLEDEICRETGDAPAVKYQDRLAECEAALEEAKNSASPST